MAERVHGGAPLANFPLTYPGFLGLNTQSSGALLGPSWATTLANTVFDDANRVSSRKGYSVVSSGDTGFSGQVVQLYEYLTHAGGTELIGTDNAGGLRRSQNLGANWTSVIGTATLAGDGNIQFVNFNDNLYGWQTGGTGPIQYSGTTFSNLTGTNVPTGSVAHAAYGRIWAADSNGTDLRYCALLDATDWSGADAGVFDMTNIWPGVDTIQAIASFNGLLVVFGERNIVLFGDKTGTELGIDPTQTYVVDLIVGTGCFARDSVQGIKGDLWFLDVNGLQSLDRVRRTAESAGVNMKRSGNAFNNISKNVQDTLAARIAAVNSAAVRSVYIPEDSLYVLALPSADTDSEEGVSYVFDTRQPAEDGSYRCAGVWTRNVFRAVTLANSGVVYTWTMDGSPVPTYSNAVYVEVGKYSGYDDNGNSYNMLYRSGWSNFSNIDPNIGNRLKMLKQIAVIAEASTDGTMSALVEFDFDVTPKTFNLNLPAGQAPSEWGTGEWALDEWGAGDIVYNVSLPVSGTGEYIRLGLSATIDGGSISLQQVDLGFKVGRVSI